MMDRRKLLRLGMLTGGTLALPGITGFGSIDQKWSKPHTSGHVQLTMGDIQVFIFSDGHIVLEDPQPIFAPEIDSENVRTQLEKIHLAQDRLDGAINVMLIRTGGRTILIDTGSGHHFGESGGRLPENLQNAGIRATDITDIFITHAHTDHIGGILTKDGALVYPNAKYHIAKGEYDFWMSTDPDFSKSKSPDDPGPGVGLARRTLELLGERLTLFHYGDVLFSCIRTELAKGHTPGHTTFTLFSGKGSLRHIVDTVHTPLLISRPDWGTQWDVDFHLGIQTREQILKDSWSERTLVMATHLPWPGLGYIGKNGSDYQWVPISYYTPNEIVL